jgi:ubiquinol-cytochrome c reductase iron-sulfur subunit
MRKHERWLAAIIALAGLASLGFIGVYFYTKSRLDEGLALSVMAAAFSAVAVGWFAWLLPHEQVVDQRDEYPSDVAERREQRERVGRAESEVTRSGMLVRLLGAALGIFGLAAIVPIRSLGPAPTPDSEKSKWRAGLRVIREDGTPVAANDLNVNSAITVFPEGALDDYESQTMLIRLPVDAPVGVRGYIAYSKICTHAGCPVALYRARARQLMCPCHQSVFDVLDDGKVLSGPADRALPQLPLEIGADGYVRAAGDYDAPIGPGSWDTTS